MEHTQGEWVAKEQMVYSESDSSGKTIANCNSEANARLIAAAPDLLAACEDGIKYLDSMTSGIGLESEKQNKAAFRRILRQAITKAKP